MMEPWRNNFDSNFSIKGETENVEISNEPLALK